MKKLIFMSVVLYLALPPVFANAVLLGLGPWDEGAAGSTHQMWDFTPANVLPSGAGFTADPENVSNPNPPGVVATLTPVLGGGLQYDGQTAFIGEPAIFVALEIPNFEIPNYRKEIWVDIGEGLIASNITVSAHDGGSVTFSYEILPGQGDAEFGVMIYPNPDYEKINFYVESAPGAAAVLDYIHVDTICIPEPATLAMLGLGGLLLSRKRK